MHTATQGLVCAIALANGRHPDPVAFDFLERNPDFLERNPNLAELKTTKVGYHQEKQATAEVRDAVFKKLKVHTTYQPHPHTDTLLHAYS